MGKLASIKRINAAGTTYTVYAVTNSRGDIEELRHLNGSLIARYKYDAWGNTKVLDANNVEITNSSSIALQNPFRYRGYYYDSESGLYYLQSRYYDPVTCRFVNADEMSTLGVSPMDISDKNLYAYCDNNPINRTDNGGKLWGIVAKTILKGVVGCVTQYISDVVRNVASGKKGLEAFKPTSSVGTYIAAGVSAMIPGKGVVSSIVKNTFSEGIKYVEKRICGDQQSAKETIMNIGKGVVFDSIGSAATKMVTDKIGSFAPKNYSSYAGQQYKKNPGITRQQIEVKMGTIGKTIRVTNSTVTFAFDIIKTTVADAV